MKRFLTRKELKVKRKEMIYTVIGIAVILSLYFIFTREKKPVAETPIVSVMPASQQNVQIFGEYVGRIRAQQFVEVRACTRRRISGTNAIRGRNLSQTQSSAVRH